MTQIDLASLQLSRADGVGGSVAPLPQQSQFSDVATPFEGELCDCHELEDDGVLDLEMMFSRPWIVVTLELNALPGGAFVELVVSGALVDGTPFNASDCIVLVPIGTSTRDISQTLRRDNTPKNGRLTDGPSSP